MHADQIIIGAGVVGLAVAAKIASPTKTTLILEQADREGTGISSRNSGVIHAGIYYPDNSLKAKLCVEGMEKLYHRLETRNLPHRKTGKLIVANDEQGQQTLETLNAQALRNGVNGLSFLDKKAVAEREPACHAQSALLSPNTGIVDVHALMHDLLGEAHSKGADLVPLCQVQHIEQTAKGFRLKVRNQDEVLTLETPRLINAAGLGANRLSQALGLDVPDIHFARGIYLSYSGKNPFSHLIYPTPEANLAGLGIHGTLDMGGQLKFGPDVEWVDQEFYQMPDVKLDEWADRIARWFPSLEPQKLTPDFVGIRPKLGPVGSGFQDFRIEGQRDHGIKGYIQLLGIESPGLTSCLAIAEHVSQRMEH